MGNEDYRKAYQSAASELEKLLQEQEKTEERIMTLRKTMNVLSTLCQQEGIDTTEIDKRFAALYNMIEYSLTHDIFKIISGSTEPLTTSEVREQLKELGGSLAEHRNPLASINAILNRLTEQGKVEETLKDGRKAWKPKMIPLRSLLLPIPPPPKFRSNQSAGESLIPPPPEPTVGKKK